MISSGKNHAYLAKHKYPIFDFYISPAGTNQNIQVGSLIPSRVYNRKRGRVSYSIYYCVNALRIIKFEWLTQTNCEAHQYCSWVVSTQVGCPRPIIGQHSLNYKVVCVIYYSLQGYTNLIIQLFAVRLHSSIQSRILSLSLPIIYS